MVRGYVVRIFRLYIAYLKSFSLKVNCVSMIPVVFTLVLNTSCSVGT